MTRPTIAMRLQRVKFLVLAAIVIAGLLGSGGQTSSAITLGATPTPQPMPQIPETEVIQVPGSAAVVTSLPSRPRSAVPGLESSLAQLYAAYQAGDQATLATFAGQRHVDLERGTVRVILEMARSLQAHSAGEPTVEVVTLAGGRRMEIHHMPPMAIRADLARAIAAADATYETASRNEVQVLVPFSSLESLTRIPDVRYVRLPFPTEPQAGTQTTEGVNLTHANTAHANGYDGTGVNLAIFDLGFTGWAARQANGDLPSGGNLVLHDFSSAYSFSPDTAGYEHGTACAEVAYDMAPGSTVHLYAFGTDAEFSNAVDDYRNSVSGKRVASMSVGWVNAGPYDGTGSINTIIDNAQASGILWANSAGNSQKQHWSGTAVRYSTTDYVAFGSGNVEGIGPTPGSLWNISSDTVIRLFLEWNDWNAGRTGNQNHIDYDMYLLRWTGSGWTQVAGSIGDQCGTTVKPTEAIVYTVPAGGPYNYGLVIQRWQGGGSCPNNFGHWIQLHTYNGFVQTGQGAVNSFWYVNECNSLTIPADGDSAITVGASFWNEDGSGPLYGLETFSSLGSRNAAGGGNPGTTVNKPDVVAPDGVSGATYGASNGVNYANGGTGFWGTSAAAPHVAGLAAAAWENYPSYSLAQLRTYIQRHALYKAGGGACGDSGTQNNRYGWGRIDLNDATPVLGAIGNKSVDEETLLSFTATASDSDLPGDTLTFSLDPGAPPGTSINPTTGVFSWTPTEAQGPGVYTMTVRVTDNGLPSPLNDFETIQITVNEVHPTITGFSPTSGAIGTNVTITGTNFSEATSVQFNGTSASFTVVSATAISATVPSGATTGPIGVTTPGGTATSTSNFTVILPTLSISDTAVTEGSSGTVSAVFATTLSFSSPVTVTVNYATANNTAVAGSDYTATSGVLTFPPGATTRTATIQVIGDTTDEDDETFFVNLSSPINATIADGQGVGAILDDDPPPALSINDATVTEGDAGTVNASFTVSLSAASGKTATVNYATANDTAIAGSDYITASGTLTFTPGALTCTLTVPVIGDTLEESNETFFTNLASPVNATIADGQGVGTIVDDDSLTVTKLPDTNDGECDLVDCSLREAIAAAGSGDTIRFASGLTGTITLGSTLDIAKNLIINGPGADIITVSGNDTVQIFSVVSGMSLALNNLVIANGRAPSGGVSAIRSGTGTLLTLNHCTVTSNTAPSGSTIYIHAGRLVVNDSIFSHNNGALFIDANLDGLTSINGSTFSNNVGGTILNFHSVLTVNNSSFTGNSADNGSAIGNTYPGSYLAVNNSSFANNNATNGGALYNDSGTTTIIGDNSTFSGNSATNGGAVYNGSGGVVQLIHSTISGNTAASSGGGIYSGGTLTITSTPIVSNTATSGGGVYNAASGSATLANTNIQTNTATDSGGGSYNSGTLTITNTTIIGNISSGGYPSGGGGIYSAGALFIGHSKIISNTSLQYGGGLDITGSGATLTLDNSLLQGNYAGGPSSGAVHVSQASATIGNSTFYNNTAPNAAGGLRSAYNATVTVVNSTFANNGSAAGSNLSADNNGTITLKNSVIAYPSNDNCYGLGTLFIDGGNNLQYPGTSCGGSIPIADPLLGPLQDNGGDTLTMVLLSGSPAIDAGDNTVCAAAPINNLDQRGFPRPTDGDMNGSAICDIGAYEYLMVPPGGVTIAGPTSGVVDTPYIFMATVSPVTATVPLTYTWTPAPQSGQGMAEAAYAWATDGSKTITVTVANAGGTVTDTHAIAISVPPAGVTISGPTSGVANTTYTFTATVSPVTATAPLTYTWTPAPQSGQGTATAVYAWATDGEKAITVTVANAGGTVTDTHAIAISVPPTSVTIAGPTTGIANTAYTFTATVSPVTATTPLIYTWAPTPDSGQGTATAVYTWATDGSKTITVTVANAGGTVTDTHAIAISVPPAGVTISGPTSGVANTTYTFTATVSPVTATAPLTYTWTPAPDSGQGTTDVGYTWATDGEKTIAVTVANAGGTVTDTHTIAISVPLSGVTISGPTAGIANTAYTFTATISPVTATAPLTYTWTPTPQSGQGTATAVYAWGTDGEKSITVTVANTGGTVTDTHTVAISVPPSGVSISGPMAGIVNTAYTFTATVSPVTATTPLAHIWMPAPQSGQGTATATYIWASDGEKSITVTVTNTGGTVTDTHTITIEPLTCPSPNNVGGTIIADTIWYSQCSPYIVTANIGVAPGVTLVIQPGTTVKFNGNYSLNVGGVLIADGTQAQPITFTANITDSTWGRIYFDDPSVDATSDVSGTYRGGNILRWVRVEDAAQGIGCSSATPYLTHVTLTGGGVNCVAGGTRLWLLDGDLTGDVLISAGAGVSEAMGFWTARASMPTARQLLGVVMASNGKLYAIGGYNGGGDPATVEEYDPATNTWTTRASMPTARYGLGVAAASNGKIYAIGGLGGMTTVEEYDPAADTWTTRASMLTGRWGLGVAATSDGKIYAIGGYGGDSTVEEYDPATDTWTTRASMPTARGELGVVAVNNGRIYVIGGHNGSSYLTAVEEYDPATDVWRTRANMPTARSELGTAIASNGKIYAIGGCCPLAAVEEYDLATDTWATRASMPTARGELGVTATSNGKIYAVGGGIQTGAIATVEEFTVPSISFAYSFQRITIRGGNLSIPGDSQVLTSTIDGSITAGGNSAVQNAIASGAITVNGSGIVEDSTAGGTITLSGGMALSNTVRGGGISIGSGSVLTNTITGGGISAGSGSTVRGNNVENALSWGIQSSGSTTVVGNRVVGNANGANVGSGLVQGNLIANSTDVGLQVGAATVLSNTFTGNGGNTVVIASDAPVIRGNNLEFSKGTYDLVNNTANPITATNNWWGTTNSAAIEARIYDFMDDYNLGRVAYTSALTGPAQDAPAYVRVITMTPPSPVGFETVTFDVLFSREMDTGSNPTIVFYGPEYLWTFCANEGQFCAFSGTKEVQYGANGQYYYQMHTNGVWCDNGVFGDPAWGMSKQCYYRKPTPPYYYTIANNPQWLASNLHRDTYDFAALIPRDTYTLTISGAVGLDGIMIAPDSGHTFTVSYPTVQFSSGAYSATENMGAAIITATLDLPSALTVTVNYSTTGGTAATDSDYITATGTLTFTPSQTVQTFAVPIIDDALDEPDETITLTLSSPANAALGAPGAATLTIIDDDLPPVHGVTLTPPTAGQSGNPGVTVTYTLCITNTGNTTDTFTLSKGSTAWTTDVPSSVGPLAAGAGADVQVVVHIPSGASGGATDVANITATSQGDGSKSANSMLTTTANSVRGVTLEPSTAGQSGAPGAAVTYTLRITNTGNAADTFTLSKGSSAWTTDIPSSVGPLAAGAGADVEVVVHIPSGASGGATDVAGIIATSQGDGSKSANSTLTTTANVVRGMTLTPSIAGQSGAPGAAVTYTLRITNTGNVADTFTLSKGSTAWTTDVPGSVGPLAAGAGADVQVVVYIPSGASGGATDAATVTATSQGDGSKSANSTLTTTVTPATPIVTSITPSSGLNTGVVHITNLAGNNFQPGAGVYLTRSGQATITATDVTVVGSSQIACDLDLSRAAIGQWNVVVTNPGGQSGQLADGFAVRTAVYLPLVLRQYP